jgi:signal transduction histidine kinase
MKEGGEIHLISRLTDSSWRLEVRDNGPGIPEEIRGRLFEAFSSHGKSNGTGLGLALAKQFIEQHAGTITVVTGPGQGTAFTLELPLEMDIGEVA